MDGKGVVDKIVSTPLLNGSSSFSQVDYQCFDFLPRHHNIIRFRKGIAMIKNDFHTVCSWERFKNDVKWKYDLMLRQ